ncbi:hypothetical protein [Amedibacterium intestinale]|uniref:hypothetical protein n=1 Tax=Amedibacterium intestinale TaxID=2583452 RepID=UPI000E517EE4|nr:hypothetical protein [Amedibacterium intestinale]RHO23223.1 hypothetical protein DW220_03165 [Eubacterium sp. AM18-26]RHO27582.1 hypothetical protein DW212_02950 [Eubacterium sp. AM18-10LB-B]
MKEHINVKSIGITLGLLLLTCFIFYLGVAVFISGPKFKYEADILEQEKMIQKEFKDIKDLHRHVFQYTTYVGKEENRWIWFNEKGVAITSREDDTVRFDEARRNVEDKYNTKVNDVQLGYGYNNPVYVVYCELGEVLLDYETLEEVYIIRTGGK